LVQTAEPSKEKLIKLFDCCETLSTKEDLLKHLKMVLLLQTARALRLAHWNCRPRIRDPIGMFPSFRLTDVTFFFLVIRRPVSPSM